MLVFRLLTAYPLLLMLLVEDLFFFLASLRCVALKIFVRLGGCVLSACPFCMGPSRHFFHSGPALDTRGSSCPLAQSLSPALD